MIIIIYMHLTGPHSGYDSLDGVKGPGPLGGLGPPKNGPGAPKRGPRREEKRKQILRGVISEG